jgi:hypothetical protein
MVLTGLLERLRREAGVRADFMKGAYISIATLMQYLRAPPRSGFRGQHSNMSHAFKCWVVIEATSLVIDPRVNKQRKHAWGVTLWIVVECHVSIRVRLVLVLRPTRVWCCLGLVSRGNNTASPLFLFSRGAVRKHAAVDGFRRPCSSARYRFLGGKAD